MAHSISIEDEGIQWSDCGTMVALPPCDCPGRRQLFVKVVFTEEELADAMINEVEEYVDQVADRDFELIRTSLKQQLKIDVPQKVMLVKNYRVTGSHQHPMVARHQALGEQLKAIGKHPPQEEALAENEVTHE
ncbi:MAG TPA: hypothetical protein VHV10_02285 [Ktedonobacteraceae bacterium]|nr:hypothetical protein [Ktedonobacteraceae bacterium]